jgi:hypothetical protein
VEAKNIAVRMQQKAQLQPSLCADAEQLAGGTKSEVDIDNTCLIDLLKMFLILLVKVCLK